MTDAQQKVLDWCDRNERETHTSCGMLVYKETPCGRPDESKWFAGIREYVREDMDSGCTWSSLYVEWADQDGNTPEEAIAKLADVLGL